MKLDQRWRRRSRGIAEAASRVETKSAAVHGHRGIRDFRVPIMKFSRILFTAREASACATTSRPTRSPGRVLSHYDERLGQFVYTGFKANGARCQRRGRRPARGLRRDVAGKRYG
jgi:hypothetical protein